LHIAKRLDDLKVDVLEGGDGDRFLTSVRQLRKEAQDIYRKKDPLTPLERREAEAIMKAADILEGVLTDNLPVIKDRDAFLKARTAQAKLYQLEEATDLANGVTDPRVFAKMINDKRPITGVARDMGLFAASFPDFVTPTGKGGWTFPRLTRATAPGMIGGTLGLLAAGPVGAPFGIALGSGIGELGKRALAKNMLTPEFQAKNAVPTDYRPAPFPTNNLRPVTPGQSNIVPFNPANALLDPEIRPNFVFGKSPPLVDRANLNPSSPWSPPQLPAPSPQSTLASVASEEARRTRLAQMAEAQSLSAEKQNFARPPTKGEVILDIDPITGKLLPQTSQGIKGATLETFQDYMSTLKTAVDKVSANKNFNLSAAEKVAFDKTKFYIAEVSPGFEKLSDKAIVSRMMDRKWVEDAVVQAREKSLALDQAAIRSRSPEMMDARATSAQNAELARRAEEASGQMKTTLDLLEDQLRKLRADTSGKRQGPKTQGEIRNNLTANRNRNKLRDE
jgi:hypothetical protein